MSPQQTLKITKSLKQTHILTKYIYKQDKLSMVTFRYEVTTHYNFAQRLHIQLSCHEFGSLKGRHN